MLMNRMKLSRKTCFNREKSTWDTKIVAEGVPGDSRSVTFPFVEVTVREVFEQDQGTMDSLRTEYEYNNFGNLTKLREMGRSKNESWDDERVTTSLYSSDFVSGINNWILDRVIQKSVKDEMGELIAETRNFYDESDTLGEITKGDINGGLRNG